MEGLVRPCSRRCSTSSCRAFPRLTYAEAMRDYGSDKPDLRVTLELTELTDVMRRRRLQGVPGRGRAAERARRGAARAGRRQFTRKELDDLDAVRRDLRREGPRVHQGERRREAERGGAAVADREVPLRELLREILERTGAQSGDLIFFGADREKVVNDALGALRAKVGHERGFAESGWKPLWVVDFPDVRVRRGQARRWGARHHPFTAPKDEHEDRSRPIPASALAKAYDVVLNGWEIGGGSVRIHRADVQAKVFEALGIGAEEQRASSASCSTRSRTARRRTAASPSASTAWWR